MLKAIIVLVKNIGRTITLISGGNGKKPIMQVVPTLKAEKHMRSLGFTLLILLLLASKTSTAIDIPPSVQQLNADYMVVKNKHLDTWVPAVKVMFDASVEYHKMGLLYEMGGIEGQIKAFTSANPLLSESDRIRQIRDIIAAAPVRNKIKGFSFAGNNADDIFSKAIRDVGRQIDDLSLAGISTSDANLLDQQFSKIGTSVANILTATMEGVPIRESDIYNLEIRGLGPVKRAALKGYFTDLEAIKSDLPKGLTTPKWVNVAGNIATIGGGVLDGLQLVSSTINISSGVFNVQDVWNATSATTGLVSIFVKSGQKVALPIALIEATRNNTEKMVKLTSMIEDDRHWEAAILDPNEKYLNPLQMQQFYTDMANDYITQWTIEHYGLEKAVDERNLNLLAARVLNLIRTRDAARELLNGDTKWYLSNYSLTTWLGLGVPADVVANLNQVAEPSLPLEDMFHYYRQKLQAEETKDLLAYFEARKTQLANVVNPALNTETGNLPVLEIIVANRADTAFDAATSQLSFTTGETITLRLHDDPNHPNGFAGLSGSIKVYAQQLTGDACPLVGTNGYCQFDAGNVQADGSLVLTIPTAGIYHLILAGASGSGVGFHGMPVVVTEEPAQASGGGSSIAPHPLNDTGISNFSNADANGLLTEPADYPGQDARYGRDAQAGAGKLTKTGGGGKGFDYTKIANNGTVLPAGATLGGGTTDWACTRDNVTGLIWEVKTSDGGLRDQNWTYSWYNRDNASNGGSAGTANAGRCRTDGRCDTEKFVADVNTAGLCGYNDWRMPNVKELAGMIDYGRIYSSIDPIYFPNTPNSHFWSGSPSVISSLPDPFIRDGAWFVNFEVGDSRNNSSYYGLSVRLVRGGH